MSRPSTVPNPTSVIFADTELPTRGGARCIGCKVSRADAIQQAKPARMERTGPTRAARPGLTPDRRQGLLDAVVHGRGKTRAEGDRAHRFRLYTAPPALVSRRSARAGIVPPWRGMAR